MSNTVLKDIVQEIRVLKRIREEVAQTYMSAVLNNSRSSSSRLRTLEKIDKQLELLVADKQFYKSEPTADEIAARNLGRHLGSK